MPPGHSPPTGPSYNSGSFNPALCSAPLKPCGERTTMTRYLAPALAFALVLATAASSLLAGDIKQTEMYRRIRAGLDEVLAIESHTHLRLFIVYPFRYVSE